MQTTDRRTFILHVAAGTTALAASCVARAAAKKIDENEPKAQSLGYRNDSTQVDKKRFPKHGAGEKCSGCMAWLGKPSDAWAECDLLVDRIVSASGWCSSYVKAK
jgi:hypothetical protein